METLHNELTVQPSLCETFRSVPQKTSKLGFNVRCQVGVLLLLFQLDTCFPRYLQPTLATFLTTGTPAVRPEGQSFRVRSGTGSQVGFFSRHGPKVSR